MRISQNLHQTFLLEDDYLNLTKLIERCQSQQECINILLDNNHYQLIYSTKILNNTLHQCLYHFIRSRVAWFQDDFPWFQREVKALAKLWLENEPQFNQSLNRIGKKRLINLLSFHQIKTSNRPIISAVIKQPTNNNQKLEEDLKFYLLSTV